jgi:glycerophosphoryl diester phosphodiesterase
LRGNSVQVIAHRGGAKESTENTIASFERALRVGAEGIETDLRLTRDGVVVLYHDDRFGRVEGLAPAQRTRPVAEMTFAELSAQTLVPVGEDTGGRRVPTLQELLGAVKTGWLNIELKRGPRFDELVDKTVSILRDFSHLDRVVLEPPDLKTAERLRDKFGPRLKLQINPSFEGSAQFDKTLKRVLKFKPHSISVSHERLSRQVVDSAHRAGVEVWVYTVDSPETAQAMRLMGADAIKTDRPSMLIELFKRQASN